MLKHKRNIAILCVVLLAASMIVGGTLAYFHDEATALNPFTTAGNGGSDDSTGIGITLSEPNWDPEEAEDMVPGDTIMKDPTIYNDKDRAYVRFIVELIDKDTQKVITDAARANKILSTLFYDPNGVISTTQKYTLNQAKALSGVKTWYNTNDFLLASTTTGKYTVNYTKNSGILAHGESCVLFTNVIIPTDWDQSDIAILGNYDVKITAQSIQAANMASASEAFAALDTQLSTSH